MPDKLRVVDTLPPTKYRAAPMPQGDLQSLQATVLALKETVEMLTLQRKNSNPPVFWDDLIRLKLAKREDHRFPWEEKPR
jgi:hypothetical protein